MKLQITAMVERWPVAGQFVIARGAKTHVDVLVAAVRCNGAVGMGEGTAIYYLQETAEKGVSQIEGVMEVLSGLEPRAAREALQQLRPPGVARNALDCALWDVEASLAGKPLWQLAGLAAPPQPLQTAFTISLGEPDVMEADAAKASARGFGLLKLKLTGEGDRDRVAAVRRGAPMARLIVDANESWGGLDIEAEAHALAALGVEMIEQPVAVGQETLLDGVRAPVPFLADESCQSRAELDLCAHHFDGINIKLDKTGGLTEALALAREAQARDLKLMVGCMLSTSLGIAPAWLAAQGAIWVDLDGPALLARDREDGFTFEGGKIIPA
jgi:L-alanine-DL-glutamate epimerase-like enolase superfamily enzyme